MCRTCLSPKIRLEGLSDVRWGRSLVGANNTIMQCTHQQVLAMVAAGKSQRHTHTSTGKVFEVCVTHTVCTCTCVFFLSMYACVHTRVCIRMHKHTMLVITTGPDQIQPGSQVSHVHRLRGMHRFILQSLVFAYGCHVRKMWETT